MHEDNKKEGFMKKIQMVGKHFLLMATAGFVGFTNNAFSAAFQLWEQDGASIGNYHAGRAAIAEDASTSFYNPAGLVRIKNQQLVLGIVPITTDFLFEGTIAVNMIDNDEPHPAKGQGGTLNFVPDMHYVAPLLDNLVFGLSLVVPYGLQTKYDDESIVRYAATKTGLQVFDIAPSLGFAINDKLSIGVGADIEFSHAQFDLVATAFSPILDSEANNSLSGHGLGYHLGVLYQFSPQTRLGVSYHSKVTHHFRDGESHFTGPLANGAEGGEQSSDKLKTDATIPATSTLSLFHSFNPKWDVMATVSYIQWNVFDEIVLENVSGIDNQFNPSDKITIIIPQNFRNSWTYTVGANYHVNERWFIRTGAGFDQTPANDDDRNLQLPDSDRIIAALGTHFQATKTLGFDISWAHFFDQNNVPLDVSQEVGGQITTTKGTVKGNADVYGFQMTWNIV